MEGFHCHIKTISRSKKESALEAAAYQVGGQLRDENTNKLTRNYADREGRVASFIQAPRGAPKWVFDRETLWSKAAASETRKNSQEARSIVLAIPRQLNEAQKIGLVKTFVDTTCVSRGMVADVAYHNDKQNHNPHAHILLTMRRLTQGGFSSHKERTWNTLGNNWRASWSALASKALFKAGFEKDAAAYFFAHLTLEEQRAAALARGDGKLAEKLNHTPTRHDGVVKRAQMARGDQTAKPRPSPSGALKMGTAASDSRMRQVRAQIRSAWDGKKDVAGFVKELEGTGYRLVQGDRRPFCLVRYDKDTSTFFCHNLSRVLMQNGKQVRTGELEDFFASSAASLPTLKSWCVEEGFKSAQTSALRRSRRPHHRRKGIRARSNVNDFSTRGQVDQYRELCRNPMCNMSGWNDSCQTNRKKVGLLSSGSGMDVTRGQSHSHRVRPIRSAGSNFPVAPFVSKYASPDRPLIRNEIGAIQAFFDDKLTLPELQEWRFLPTDGRNGPPLLEKGYVAAASRSLCARRGVLDQATKWRAAAEASVVSTVYGIQIKIILEDKSLSDAQRRAAVQDLRKREKAEVKFVRRRVIDAERLAARLKRNQEREARKALRPPKDSKL